MTEMGEDGEVGSHVAGRVAVNGGSGGGRETRRRRRRLVWEISEVGLWREQRRGVSDGSELWL